MERWVEEHEVRINRMEINVAKLTETVTSLRIRFYVLAGLAAALGGFVGTIFERLWK